MNKVVTRPGSFVRWVWWESVSAEGAGSSAVGSALAEEETEADSEEAEEETEEDTAPARWTHGVITGRSGESGRTDPFRL
ncbi:hypothetical protein PHYPO_G00040060 [Pangasianodon hypophthalmus]|uniref:Uncharacterized protein n=1 Tax=Pangasianodon hypophthalmus TaxID=310915 RepID=A0A5N5MGY0_PANHP|nr:hypothetical protein PHYPO_G00040060 [Pangasianodon hypophthalmus]